MPFWKGLIVTAVFSVPAGTLLALFNAIVEPGPSAYYSCAFATAAFTLFAVFAVDEREQRKRRKRGERR